MGGSIPFPALDLRPIQQPDIMENYGRLLQLQNMAQTAPLQRQLMQQQVQLGQLENQQKQIDLKDRQGLSAAYQKWAQPAQSAPPSNMPQGMTGGPPAPTKTAPDYDKLLDLVREQGVSFSGYQTVQKSILDMKEKAAQIAKDDAQTGSDNATALKTKNGLLTDAMTGVMSLPDDQIVAGLLSAAQDLGQNGLLDPQHIQMAQQLAQSGDPATIRKTLGIQIAGMGGFSKMLDEATKKTDLLKKQGESDPNSPFFNPSAPAVALGTAPGTAATQSALINQKAAEAGADAKARMPYQVQVAAAEGAARAEVAAQVARGSDAALARVPPHLIAPATAAALKAGTDYAQTNSVSQRLAEMMKAAKGGNVVSYQVIPEEGALQLTTSQGVHRINIAEIQNYGGGGSAAQRLQGFFGKALSGKSIPDSVLNDMSQVQDIMARGAQVKYQNDLKVANQTYGADFKPVEMQSMAPSGGQGASSAPSPQTHTFSLGAWQKANPKGDPNAAKAAAEQQGYQVVQ